MFTDTPCIPRVLRFPRFPFAVPVFLVLYIAYENNEMILGIKHVKKKYKLEEKQYKLTFHEDMSVF